MSMFADRSTQILTLDQSPKQQDTNVSYPRTRIGLKNYPFIYVTSYASECLNRYSFYKTKYCAELVQVIYQRPMSK